MKLNDCYNFNDFRKLAKKKIPSPIFHYIDGGADDEQTLRRNTESFNDCDLVPNILASVGELKFSLDIFKESKIGYSYSHISNNDWGDKNPGVDNQTISFFKNFLI